ncbi:hypothetical protein J4G37_32920 [Microvirga sp. 3-52]|nr:hypothetical protein [Microvirga sp. 3-52]
MSYMYDHAEVRRHAAYREASHAVIGYWFGWLVTDEGIRIDPDGYCGQCCYGRRCTREDHAHILLAGWLAEVRLAPDRCHPRTDEDLIETLNHLSDDEFAESDDGKVLTALKVAHPDEDTATIIARYRWCEWVTGELLDQPHIWSVVQRIAKASIRQGQLSQDEVEKLLPDGFLLESHWWRRWFQSETERMRNQPT